MHGQTDLAQQLAVAQRQGRLHRNFQGYSTYADCDMLSFGISSISKVGPTYSQNVKTLDEYYDRLDARMLPVFRGIELNADDILRRSIIQALMCHFELSLESIESAHLIDFHQYFAAELDDLKEMERAGLLKVERYSLPNHLAGRELVRELMQADCTPAALADALEPFLRVRRIDPALLAEYERLHRLLGGDADRNAAAAVLG